MTTDPKELARECLNLFTNIPFPTSPSQAKYFSGILIDSHIQRTKNDEDAEMWKAAKREHSKI